MMITSEIEHRIITIEVITELFNAYISREAESLNRGCLSFLAENLQKNLEEIDAILRKDA